MANSELDGYWQRLRQPQVNRRRVLAGGATVITGGVALGLVGCGSSNNNSSKATTSNAATQAAVVPSKAPATAAAAMSAVATTAAASASPTAVGARAATTPVQAGSFKTGGTIQAITVGGGNLDPVANTTYRTQVASGFHYGRLFRFNAGPDPKVSLSREPVPDLVTGYEVTADGMTYTMKLRKDAVFHPPLSRPLTSADVAASYQYFTTNAKNTNKDVFAPIVDTLTTPDDSTLVWKLKQPYAPFPNKLGNTNFLWIMSQDAVSGKIDPEKQAIGTGPWIFVEISPTAWTWKKNPNYFIKGIPYADGAVLNIIPDASTAEAQLAAGKLDYYGLPPADLESMQKQIPKANVAEYVVAGLSFFFFSNINDPASPFRDPRVRQAASMAVDRQGLIDSVYNKRGIWCNLVPPGLGKWYLDPQGKDAGDSGKYFKFDPQAAKQLLQAAGLANTELRYLYPNNAYGDVYNASADAIRGMLSDAGFKIQTVTVDYLKDWIDPTNGMWSRGKLPPNGFGFALQSAFSDPDDYFAGMLLKGGNRNNDLMDDADIAALVKKQQVEPDENKRLQLVFDVQRANADKMFYVPCIYTKAYLMSNPWVQNLFVADDYNYGTESWAYMSVNNR